MKATEVTAGLAESNGSLLPGLWHESLHVTCGLTACTPGSAPGPTLGNEYEKLYLLKSFFNLEHDILKIMVCCHWHFKKHIHTLKSTVENSSTPLLIYDSATVAVARQNE